MSTTPGTTVGAGMRAATAAFALQRICRITDPTSKGTKRLHCTPRRPIAVGRCHAEMSNPLHGVMEVLEQLVVALVDDLSSLAPPPGDTVNFERREVVDDDGSTASEDLDALLRQAGVPLTDVSHYSERTVAEGDRGNDVITIDT